MSSSPPPPNKEKEKPAVRGKQGHIGRIELDNFKSWRGKQTIGPFSRDLTAIVGPNGSGKSNVVDALSFVIGGNAKKLRGEQLKDLVYNGDQRAERENRSCAVSLVYVVAEGEVEGMGEGEELVFTRRVSMSASGSTFEIQGRRATWESYEAKLAKLGVLASARNFMVFQGDVESTASKSPTELARFFEQISGSIQYAEEYEKLRLEKERLESVALEAIQRKKEIASERKEAKEEKLQHEQLVELKKERDDLQVERALFHINQLGLRLRVSQLSLNEAKAGIAEAERVEEAMGDELKRTKTEAAGRTKEAAKMESALAKAAKSAAQLRGDYAKQTEAFNRVQKRKKEAESALRHAQEALEKQVEEIKKLNETIATFKQKEEELTAAGAPSSSSSSSSSSTASDAAMSESQLSDEQRTRLEELRARANEETAALRSEASRLEREIEIQRDRLNIAEESDNQLRQRLAELEGERQQLERRREKMQSSIQMLEQKVREGERAAEERAEELKRIFAELETKRGEAEEAKALLNNAKARNQETKRSKRMEDVVAALSRHFEGVRGRVVDLVRPTQRKYALAVETALGRHLDSIVVDREATAFECLKYLRDQRLGVATFIPLDTVRPAKISETLRARVSSSSSTSSSSTTSAYRLCLDVLEYDDQTVGKAVQFAAGNAVVCDTLDGARALCFGGGNNSVKCKAVTLEGHVISARGEMTGGATAFSAEGRLDRFGEAALQTARETRDRLEREMLELERRASAIQSGSVTEAEVASANAANRLKFAKTDLEATQAKMDELDSKLENCREGLRVSGEKRDAVKGEVETLQTQLETVRAQVDAKEDEVFAEFTAEVPAFAVRNVRELERRESEARAKRQAELSEVREQLRKLESQVRYVESRDRSQQIAEAEASVREAAEEGGEAERAAQEAKTAMEEAERQVTALESGLTKLNKESSTVTSKVKEAQARLAAASKEKGGAMKLMAQIEGEVQKVRSKLREVKKQARLEGLELPVKRQQAKSRRSSASRGSKKSSSSSGTTRRGKKEDEEETGENDDHNEGENDVGPEEEEEEDEDVYDFSKVEANEGWPKELWSQAQIDERDATYYAFKLKELGERIEAHASSVRADARFEEVTNRLKDSDQVLNEAREAVKEAEVKFEEVRRRRTEAFVGMFSHVAEAIDGIYKELTKRESAPMGGTAVLTIENGEEPYLGGVKFDCQPPNKRFRPMEQLSGGEKTVAALALLFAIHSYRPAPFFIMDEVDAALDNDNVGRVSSYIRQRSRHGEEGEAHSRRGKSSPARVVGGEDDHPKSEEPPFQCLVVSLKDDFYGMADEIVGIYRELKEDSSRFLTLDLSGYAF